MQVVALPEPVPVKLTFDSGQKLSLEGYLAFCRANPDLRAMLDLQKSDYRSRHWHDYFEAGAWGALQALLGTAFSSNGAK